MVSVALAPQPQVFFMKRKFWMSSSNNNQVSGRRSALFSNLKQSLSLLIIKMKQYQLTNGKVYKKNQRYSKNRVAQQPHHKKQQRQSRIKFRKSLSLAPRCEESNSETDSNNGNGVTNSPSSIYKHMDVKYQNISTKKGQNLNMENQSCLARNLLLRQTACASVYSGRGENQILFQAAREYLVRYDGGIERPIAVEPSNAMQNGNQKLEKYEVVGSGDDDTSTSTYSSFKQLSSLEVLTTNKTTLTSFTAQFHLDAARKDIIHQLIVFKDQLEMYFYSDLYSDYSLVLRLKDQMVRTDRQITIIRDIHRSI